jgi:hypothetical protein
VAVVVVGYRLYSEALRTVRELEQRQIAPLVANVTALLAKVDGILTDVKEVTTRVTRQTERVDSAIQTTVHRVDETAERVRTSVASRVNQMMGIIHGARYVVGSLFHNRASRGASVT